RAPRAASWPPTPGAGTPATGGRPTASSGAWSGRSSRNGCTRSPRPWAGNPPALTRVSVLRPRPRSDRAQGDGMRRRGGTVIGLLVGVLALGLAGCGGGDEGGSASGTTAPETTGGPGATASVGGNELQLTAQGTAWDPTSFDLRAGACYSVEVRNQDSI